MVKLVSRAGCVYFHDESLDRDIIALTPDEAIWFTQFLAAHPTIDLVISLTNAAMAARSDTNKEFLIRRS